MNCVSQPHRTHWQDPVLCSAIFCLFKNWFETLKSIKDCYCFHCILEQLHAEYNMLKWRFAFNEQFHAENRGKRRLFFSVIFWNMLGCFKDSRSSLLWILGCTVINQLACICKAFTKIKLITVMLLEEIVSHIANLFTPEPSFWSYFCVFF